MSEGQHKGCQGVRAQRGGALRPTRSRRHSRALVVQAWREVASVGCLCRRPLPACSAQPTECSRAAAARSPPGPGLMLLVASAGGREAVPLPLARLFSHTLQVRRRAPSREALPVDAAQLPYAACAHRQGRSCCSRRGVALRRLAGGWLARGPASPLDRDPPSSSRPASQVAPPDVPQRTELLRHLLAAAAHAVADASAPEHSRSAEPGTAGQCCSCGRCVGCSAGDGCACGPGSGAGATACSGADPDAAPESPAARLEAAVAPLAAQVGRRAAAGAGMRACAQPLVCATPRVAPCCSVAL
jgi:hypothetical protein